MPPWLQQLMQENRGQMTKPFDQSQAAPGVQPAIGVGQLQSQGGVSGNDFLTVFSNALAQHLGTQDQLAGKRQDIIGSAVGYDPVGASIQKEQTDRADRSSWNNIFQSPQTRLADMTNKTGAYAPSTPAFHPQGGFIPQPGGMAATSGVSGMRDMEEPGANVVSIPHADPGHLAAFRRRFDNTPMAYTPPNPRKKPAYAMR